MTPHFSENQHFGNVLIRGIAEIQLPEPVSWAPIAPGWVMVWSALGIIVLWVLTSRFLKWRQNRYRREALGTLRNLKREAGAGRAAALSMLPRLLKATALMGFPRTRVASLSGEKWIDFLYSRHPDPRIKGHAGKHLLAVSYQRPETWAISDEQAAALFCVVEKWIRHHRREAAS